MKLKRPAELLASAQDAGLRAVTIERVRILFVELLADLIGSHPELLQLGDPEGSLRAVVGAIRSAEDMDPEPPKAEEPAPAPDAGQPGPIVSTGPMVGP